MYYSEVWRDSMKADFFFFLTGFAKGMKNIHQKYPLTFNVIIFIINISKV